MKMFIKDINHPVAEPPQQKQRGDQCKRHEKIPSVWQAKQSAAGGGASGGLGGFNRCNHFNGGGVVAEVFINANAGQESIVVFL
ncbi:MAG TPA: hypothetical protein VF988_05150 [Verrucomicrobiae bacterium]